MSTGSLLRPVCLALAALLCAGASAEERILGEIMAVNTTPVAREGVAVAPKDTLGFAFADGKAVVMDGDKALPTQAANGILAAWVKLAPGESKKLVVREGDAAASLAAIKEKLLRPEADTPSSTTFTVLGNENKWRLRVEKTPKGVSFLGDGKNGIAGAPAFDVWVFGPDLPTSDPWVTALPKTMKEAADYTAEAVTTGPLLNIYKLAWANDLAKIGQEVFLAAGDPAARFEVTVESKTRIQQIMFACHDWGSYDCDSARFYPENERPAGLYNPGKGRHHGKYAAAPGYAYAFSETKGGLGIAIPEPGLFSRLAYGISGTQDLGFFRYKPAKGIGSQFFFEVAESGMLLDQAPGTVFKGTAYAVIGGAAGDGETQFQRLRGELKLVKADTSLPPPKNEPSISIERVWPNKVLYARNEDATCDVVLRNWRPTPATVELTLTQARELDSPTPLATQKIGLAPLERKVVNFKWNTGADEFGRELRATARFDGKTVAEASECCVVADDWLKVMQDSTGSDRGFYCNLRRIHNVVTEKGSLRVPEGDVELLFRDAYNINGKKLREELAACKAEGVKPCFYIYVGELKWGSTDSAWDPRKILFGANGQPERMHADILTPNIFDEKFRDWLVGEFDWAIANLGWEAVFFDVSQAPYEYARDKFDWEGKKAGAALGTDPDTIAAAFYKDFLARIKATHPKFQFTHNPEVFKSEFLAPKSYAAAGNMVMLEMGGGGGALCEANGVYGQWDSMCASMLRQRETKRRYGYDSVRTYPLTMCPLGGETCYRTFVALTFASGFNNALGGDLPSGSPQADWMVKYMRFGGARYCSFIYDDTITWINDKLPVSVTAPENVLWKDFVFKRELPGETQLITHLVQLPPSKTVWRQPEGQKTLTNLQMTITPPPGKTVKEVWLLSPDRNTADQKLEFKVADGKASITVPDLLVYDVLVARLVNRAGAK